MVVVILYNINSPGLDVLLCLYSWVCVSVRACACMLLLFPWQGFHKAFFILVSPLFSPLATPPCITALRLLRSLFLSSLIDMQQPTSLNCVFYAPWFSAHSSSLVFPFLGQLNDVSIHCLLLPWRVEIPFSFTCICTIVKAYKMAVQWMNACWSLH